MVKVVGLVGPLMTPPMLPLLNTSSSAAGAARTSMATLALAPGEATLVAVRITGPAAAGAVKATLEASSTSRAPTPAGVVVQVTDWSANPSTAAAKTRCAPGSMVAVRESSRTGEAAGARTVMRSSTEAWPAALVAVTT